jgi:DNA-binding response OmpR family regulator
MYNKNKVVPRFVLAEHVWGEEYDPFETTNLIDAQIKNIRKKIGDGKDKRMLQTVWGVGFIISDKAQ